VAVVGGHLAVVAAGAGGADECAQHGRDLGGESPPAS
jgi:hypothetical protein